MKRPRRQPQHDASSAEAPEHSPILVGIGISAVHPEAVERFIGALTAPMPFAFVIVAQQRELLDEERLRARLAAVDGLTVAAAEDGAELTAGCFYLAAPGITLTVAERRLHVRAAEQRPGERATIDSFFLSMAQDFGERAMGIVMSGTGGDGALGVTAIREHGGLTLAEREGEDQPNALAGSNHPAALADFLLDPEQMPERLALHARQVAVINADEQLNLQSAGTATALAQIATVLRNKTGHDFHGYKPNTFLRRVHRRMQVTGAADLDHYVEVLRNEPAEPQNLFNDLLIGVTQFFRDAKEFELLEQLIVPGLFAGKEASDQLRVWVLGCATGEEAYSLAILLREHMAKLDVIPQVQIFATDIDGRALAAARVGRYAESIVNDVTPERLARWFVKEGNTYCVVKEVREMCIFSGHNVIRDAPFSRLDLISCRNLLIYLNGDLQQRIIPLFHFALRPNGALFLGNSENVTRHTKLFAAVDRRARIFRRLETSTRVLPDFAVLSATARGMTVEPVTGRRPITGERLARRAEALVERYAPAYAIIDEKFDVLHFSARTGRYIDPPGGTASLNILNLVHRDLRLDLRAILQRVVEGERAARADRVSMGTNGSRLIVDLVAETIREKGDGPRAYIVVFKDGITVADEADNDAGNSSIRDEHVRRLENELRSSRDRLQATIEELESTNEELKSSNEEYQSLNEELQSANEELETSKEELQSVNEEVTTVNGELAQRVHELGRANSDLKNLLESTQIATVFLDNDLRVMNYTPAVTEIFHLVETDIGRPIGHIKPKLPLGELQDDVRRVLRTLATVEREIRHSETDGLYIARILPYRSVDNFIAGVVVTFMDVTKLTRAESALRESDRRFRALADSSPDAILIVTEKRIVYANRASTKILGASSVQQMLSLAPADIFQTEFIHGFLERLDHGEHGESDTTTELGFRRLDGSPLTVEMSIGSITWDGRPAAQLALRDISERKQGEERQAMLLAELQHRVRNTISVLRSIARRSAATSETVQDYSAHLDGRINAFARVQTAVTRDPGAGVDLEGMVADELQAYQVKEGDQVQITGPQVRFRPKAAEIFGLALHELATNAVKHGALGDPAGQIEVRWQINAEKPPVMAFEWIEKRPRAIALAPTRRGFGTELLERTLSYKLDAPCSLDFSSGNLTCRITLELGPDIVVAEKD